VTIILVFILLYVICLFIADNIIPNPSAGASRVPAAETGAVPKQSSATCASTADHNSVPSSSSNVYPNIFPQPTHVPLQPAQAPLAPHPPHMPVHSNSVFNPVPPQAFMQHPPISKYCISDWLIKGEMVFCISGSFF
jgi:hypothetical protein